MLKEWANNELAGDDLAYFLSKLRIELVYNTAMLAARFLRSKIQPTSKVMCIGNDGLLIEV